MRREPIGELTLGVAKAPSVPLIGSGHLATQYDVSFDGQHVHFIDRTPAPRPSDIPVVIGGARSSSREGWPESLIAALRSHVGHPGRRLQFDPVLRACHRLWGPVRRGPRETMAQSEPTSPLMSPNNSASSHGFCTKALAPCLNARASFSRTSRADTTMTGITDR